MITIAYIGTPDISANVLRYLFENKNELQIEIDHVVTQPDQPVGRKQIITPSPVKVLAKELALPVLDEINNDRLKDTDLAVLFAYGKIISLESLYQPKHGFWNVHPSLLPAYRGATPLTFPLLLDEKETGVTLMQMDQDLDHGEIIEQSYLEINSYTTRLDLEDTLIKQSFKLLKNNIRLLNETGSYPKTPQDHSLATFTRPLEKKDGYVELNLLKKALQNEFIGYPELPALYKDWYFRNKIQTSTESFSATLLVKNMYRSLIGWPGLWTYVKINETEKRLKLLELDLERENLTILKVQLEGKAPVDFKTFNQAYALL